MVFAALKADAYGYGIAAVAPTVLAAGASGISLVSVADAVALRRRGFEAPILLYPGVPITPSNIAVMEEYSLMPTILTLDAARLLSVTARGTLRVFVKVDVGLERLGIDPAGAASFIGAVAEMRHLILHGVYAHIHVRDNVPVAYLQWQFDRFIAVLAQLEVAGLRVPVRMTASTAVLQAVSTRMNLNAIDPGRVWFGLDKRGPGLEGLDLRPAFIALKTALVQVKAVQRDAFSEFAPFPPRPGMRIGILPFGRFDGMVSLNCGHVLIRGMRAPILATPSIEHTRIDVTDVPEASPGDEVVVIGRQGDGEILPEDVAMYQNLPSPGLGSAGHTGYGAPRVPQRRSSLA
jgi:alanine racemase